MENEEQVQLSLANIASDLVPKEFAKKFRALKKAQDELAEIENQVKDAVKQMFESIPGLETNTVTVDGIKFTYVKGSVRKTVDNKKLQEEWPDIYGKCIKTSNVKSQIRISIEY